MYVIPNHEWCAKIKTRALRLVNDFSWVETHFCYGLAELSCFNYSNSSTAYGITLRANIAGLFPV